MLTDKAKTDFLKWLNELSIAPYAVMFDELPLNVKTMYIIEWLDSVEIYILPCINNQRFSYDIKEYYSKGELQLWIGFVFENRNDANEKAIETANKIYNA